jgi:hypothetical protein
MSRSKRVFFFALILGLFGCVSPRTPRNLAGVGAQKSRCDPVPDTLLAANQSVEGLEATYRLVLVKTDSVRLPNGRFEGALYLWRTSPSDSSRDGRRPGRIDSLFSVYFGTTDVDLDATEAYAHYYGDFWRTTHNPKRADVDPIRPPILGHVFRGVYNGQPGQIFALAIGSVGNNRATGGGLDGMGIGLFVKRITRQGFFGTWGPYGIIKTGSGYFCAFRNP